MVKPESMRPGDRPKTAGDVAIMNLVEAQRLEGLRVIQERGNAGESYNSKGDYDAVLRVHCRLDPARR